MTAHAFVVVANRLPVDRAALSDGTDGWVTSPGGLVAALGPVMQRADGAWVGWTGAPDDDPEPFDADGMHLVPVALTASEIADFYEGFSNATLWPLYHDVIVSPEYHRVWWEAYVAVNRRFASVAAAHAAPGAIVWVHDYQLQLVPQMLRAERPDLRIGFFNHIPFPPYDLFAQLPWRREVLRGLLGADLVGFQRAKDARNFRNACWRQLGLRGREGRLRVPGEESGTREVISRAFPISVDSPTLAALARSPAVRERAAAIRAELGNPRRVILGVDRLDYTKGIGHRLKAYGELLAEGAVDPADTVLVQVATPSRERVEEYRRLRDDVELTVGRINGDHASLSRAAVVYLHQNHNREEMSALYLVADVLLVTPLRDGMNLVAKEYVAGRSEGNGVLILSEFTGAADSLGQALLVNPHDIAGLKEAIVRALAMPQKEQRRRMRALRRQVLSYTVQHWADSFLAELAPPDRAGGAEAGTSGDGG
jgi:alpha,alpha-trehalose-phosphate synthase [UDP-forming]